MTFEEFRGRVEGDPGMYRFTVKSGSQRLFYCGFRHSMDPRDPQFARLEEFFREFVEAGELDKAVCLVEGGPRPLRNDPEQAIVESGGEGGLATYLAHLFGLKHIEALEPEPRALFEALRARFSLEEVGYAYWARHVALWHRSGCLVKLEQFVSGSKLLSELMPLGCDLSEKRMELVHRRMFRRPLDLDDVRFFVHVTDPAQNACRINRILAEDAVRRDVFAVARILEHFRTGRSVFVVLGTVHAMMQEKPLVELIRMSCKGELVVERMDRTTE